MNIVKLQSIKSIHGNPLHSHTLTMKNERVKETISFTIATKKYKIPRYKPTLREKETCMQKTIRH